MRAASRLARARNCSRWLGKPMRTDIPRICTRRSARPSRPVSQRVADSAKYPRSSHVGSHASLGDNVGSQPWTVDWCTSTCPPPPRWEHPQCLDGVGCPVFCTDMRVFDSGTKSASLSFSTTPFPPSNLPAALAFLSHVLVGPQTLTTWESCMQVRASNHTPVCHKQGSPVHDLRHAHRVQSIPSKMLLSASLVKTQRRLGI